MGLVTGALIGLGIGAASSVASSAVASHAAGKAADTQSKAADDVSTLAQNSAATAANTVDDATTKVNDQLAGLPDAVKQYLAPYLGLGDTGTTGLKDLLTGGDLNQKFAFNPQDLQNTPGYKFTLDQGMQSIQRAASAQGKSLGGGTLKSLLKYGEGVAQTTYGNEFDRAAKTFDLNQGATKTKLGALLDATKVGQNSATDLGNVLQATEITRAGNTLDAAKYRGNTGLDAAHITAEALYGKANSQAAATVASGNAWGGALNSIGNNIGSYLTLKDLLKPPNPTASPGYNPINTDDPGGN